jgi:dissimilatory sulfite reductase (desulfoviridin) alpha/beta subunit
MSKQEQLPGVGPKRIKEIEAAAEEYVQARDTRIAWNKKEAEAKKNLADLINKHGVEAYEYDVELETEQDGKKVTKDVHRTVEYEGEPKLKVRSTVQEEPEA